jgi:hypothetical protein
MIGFGSIAKWIAIVAVVTMIGAGLNWVKNYHFDQIDIAVANNARELALASATRLTEREKELRAQSAEDKELIEQELKVERDKVTDLQRMLLVDHDLDRLLQQKPGLVLPRVNKGTEDYFKALEEATQ